MTTAKKTPEDSPEEKVTPTKKEAVDTTSAQYLQFLVSEVFDALINLQSRIEGDYKETSDDPNLIHQLQAVRSIKTLLHKVFPHAAAPD